MMSKSVRALRWMSGILALLLLASCGGGGSGGDGVPSPYSVTLSQASVTFSARYGRAVSDRYLITASFVGDGILVGTPPDSGLPSWLTLTPKASTDTTAEFELSIHNPDSDSMVWPVGTHRATLRFVTGSATTGQSVYRDLPVSFHITGPAVTQPKVLYADDPGIALTSMPGFSKLSHVVTLAASGAALGTLAATSNAAWLSARASGNQVTLTASPAGLASGQHYATVTVTSSTSGMATETLTVGLFVHDSAPANGYSLPVGSTQPFRVVADPVRPWLFQATGNGVKAVNLYTGATVFDSAALGAAPDGIDISADGKWLYARSGPGQYHRLNISTNTWTSFTIDRDSSSGSFQYLRPEGHSLLLTDKGMVIDPHSGELVSLNQFQSSLGDLLYAVSGDGQRIGTVDHGLNGALRPMIYATRYYPADAIFTATPLKNGYDSISYAQALNLNHDGTQMVLAASAPYAVLHYRCDGAGSLCTSSQLGVGGYGLNAFIDRSNTVYGSRGGEVRVFSNAGVLLDTLSAAPTTGSRALQASSDGLMLVVLTTSGNSMAYHARP